MINPNIKDYLDSRFYIGENPMPVADITLSSKDQNPKPAIPRIRYAIFTPADEIICLHESKTETLEEYKEDYDVGEGDYLVEIKALSRFEIKLVDIDG